MPDRAETLRALTEQHWPDARPFFERTAADVAAPESLGFRAAFAGVPRRLGALAETKVAVPADLSGLARPHWTLTDYVRAALVEAGLATVSEARQPDLHLTWFDAGELGEQVSLLRTMSLLPQPGRFLESALQACRTNARSVFEAIVCENPFVTEHFPDLNFNQAVMKSVFMDVSPLRIERLESRITQELKRMAVGLKSERLAAGRPVPEDIEYLIQYGA